MTPRRVPALLAALAVLSPCAVAACPVDATARAAATLLTVQVPGQPDRAYDAAGLAALPPTTLTQTLSVSNGRDGALDRRIAYGGVLLKDVLAAATGLFGPNDRGSRLASVEAVATDGYRALFSWGELFNSPAGAQALVVATQDGQPLDAAAGPLALRALGDLRPGPRHVRNLCALVVRPLPR